MAKQKRPDIYTLIGGPNDGLQLPLSGDDNLATYTIESGEYLRHWYEPNRDTLEAEHIKTELVGRLRSE